MEKSASVLILALLLGCPVYAQDVPRADVQELLQIHEQELSAWRDIVQAQQKIIEAKDSEITALKSANEKWQQAAGVKPSFWGKVWWGVKTFGPVVAGTVAAVRAD